MKFIYLFISLFIVFGCFSHLNSRSQTEENFKIYYPRCDSAKAVCMVIHGLNNKPESMQWIIDQLLSQGAIVVNTEMYGHGDNPFENADSGSLEIRVEKLKQVSWEQWMEDVGPALECTDSLSRLNSLPTCFIGYSLGGLVGASVEYNYKYTFDKYLLLAPAIRLRNLPKISIRLMSPFPNLIIKSRAPEEYREYRGMPVAAHEAMLTGIKRLKKENPTLTNCVIIVDKKDPGVSAKKLSRFAKQANATILLIEKKKKDCEFCGIHHLIIDEKSLGQSTKIVSRAIASLFE